MSGCSHRYGIAGVCLVCNGRNGDHVRIASLEAEVQRLTRERDDYYGAMRLERELADEALAQVQRLSEREGKWRQALNETESRLLDAGTIGARAEQERDEALASVARLTSELAQRDEWQQTSDAYVQRDEALAGQAVLAAALNAMVNTSNVEQHGRLAWDAAEQALSRLPARARQMLAAQRFAAIMDECERAGEHVASTGTEAWVALDEWRKAGK